MYIMNDPNSQGHSMCNRYNVKIWSVNLIAMHYNFKIDINECQNPSLNNCQQLCINTPGLYRCSCGTGYTLSTNGRSCIST